MAGHSAWKNIRHKKAAADARRGKLWSKCARAIIVAARNGGGDPDSNLTLRYAIDDAKSVNMPRETIEKAIKKGTGELGGENYESAIYEGYGPGGVAMMLEILTNNRNRSSSDIRTIMDKYGGNLGASGCVSYLFQNRGLILVPRKAVSEDDIMTLALDAGAQDVTAEGEFWRLISEPAQFLNLRKAVETAKLPIESAELTMIPTTTVNLNAEQAQKVLALIEALEDNDDVQKVHANMELSDEVLASMK